MFRTLKRAAIAGAFSSGLTTLIGNSKWRRSRLLILCYHGVSLRDEHLWEPGLYIQQKQLKSRMEFLRRTRCNLLPLGEAIDRLYSGDLPEKSVAVTFDDGWHDFHSLAFPVLKELAIPATVYLTTYYAKFNRPVFDTMVSYLLWKANGRRFALNSIVPKALILGGSATREVAMAIGRYVVNNSLTASQKDELQTEMAEHLKIDFGPMLTEKFMHIMSPCEVKLVAAGGIDVQLHTHRHRMPTSQDGFNREISDNRAEIRSMIGSNATHFCYPSGDYSPHSDDWLSCLGIASATTCVAGLCTARSNRYFLPRVLDNATTTESEFDAWLRGFADFLPKRSARPRKALQYPADLQHENHPRDLSDAW
jgi:peptidoglycan/xylan/chitin deacetylase (PgdA/CDA1 family)